MGEKLIQVVVKDKTVIKELKSRLESCNLLNKEHKIVRNEDDEFIIRTNFADENDLRHILLDNFAARISYYEDDREKSEGFPSFMKNLMREFDPEISEQKVQDLLRCVPKQRWNIYKPMILFNKGTLETPVFQEFICKVGDAFLTRICDHFPGVTHILVNSPIIEQANEKRIPYNIVPIYGNFGPGKMTEQKLHEPTSEDFDQEFWCESLQNNVLQTWAPRFTMFSRGNIVEKQRVLTFDKVEDSVVVDLYSGIGYFTLYYLQLKPRQMFCWELNPWSNQGLMRALKRLGITHKLIKLGELLSEIDPAVKVYIFQEDNANCVSRFNEFMRNGANFNISHINLGLLPTSSLIWPQMLELCCLSKTGSTVAHVHENCHVSKLDTIMADIQEVLIKLQKPVKRVEAVKLNKIKTYAPDVWHIVGDFEILS